MAAIDIRKRQARRNPEIYEPRLAISYNNLDALNRDAQWIEEAQAMFQAAAEGTFSISPQLYRGERKQQ